MRTAWTRPPLVSVRYPVEFEENARPCAHLCGRWPDIIIRVVKAAGSSRVPDGRRIRGQRTRDLILVQAVDLASAEGLDSLSLGRLGADLNISKSGVKGHFTSREDLQLAVIAIAAQLYHDRVAAPALAQPRGLPQLWQLCQGWIEFMRSGELSGRSFFLTALVEYDARPGPIRDELVQLRQRWERLFTTFWRIAQRRGHVHPGIDEHQLFYEIAALITGATLDAQLRDDLTAFDRARTAALNRLRPLTTDPQALPETG